MMPPRSTTDNPASQADSHFIHPEGKENTDFTQLRPHQNKITFNSQRVTIETHRLILVSVQEKQHGSALSAIRNCKKNMKLFATGQPIDKKATLDRVKQWEARWNESDMYSAFAVTLKDEPETTIGYVISGYGDDLGHDKESNSGYSSLAYIIDSKYWGNHYGTEGAGAIVDDFLPLIAGKHKVKTAYTVREQPDQKKEELRSLKYVYATTREDNIASVKLLEFLNFKPYRKKTEAKTPEGSQQWQREIYYIKEIKQIDAQISGCAEVKPSAR